LGKPVSGFEAQRERHARRRPYQIADLEEQLARLEQQLTNPEISVPKRAETEQQAARLRKQIERLRNPLRPSGSYDAPLYRLASIVPDNWIPYVPVNASGHSLPNVSEFSIRLRQARMPRNEDAKEEAVLDPMTRILKGEGLDGKLEWLNEEAVPRAGVKVQLTKQRVRWFDGGTYVWVGRKVTTGRGEGSSGLRFDYLK
jgi:hypothetical protein